MALLGLRFFGARVFIVWFVIESSNCGGLAIDLKLPNVAIFLALVDLIKRKR